MNLDTMSPEQLRDLKAKLDGLTDTSGRSPIRPRQLHDLRLLPTATDPRPTFFWSAESPRDGNATLTHPYPALVWHVETGEERTIHSDGERKALGATWVNTPPSAAPVLTPQMELTAALESLTEEERETILAEVQQTKRAALQERLAALPDAQLERLLNASETKRGRKKTA